MLLLDGGQWAIINEGRGSEDVLIKREDFSFPKIVPTRDVGNLLCRRLAIASFQCTELREGERE
jgi:hypothetical protein